MLHLVTGGTGTAWPPAPARCPRGTVHPPDACEITAATVVRALAAIEAARVPAASLHTGDRVVYQRGEVITVDTVATVTGWWRRNAGHLVVATRGGERLSCAPGDRSFLRVAG